MEASNAASVAGARAVVRPQMQSPPIGPVGEELTTAQAVERAIRLAQDAVRVDEAGSVEEAIALYTRSVDLIKHGLKVQSDSEVVDSAVLHKYSDLYSERIAELSRSLVADSPSAPASGTSLGSGAEGSASKDGKDGSSFAALMDDTEQKSATPPEAPPTGRDEWRRPFWLMRTLKTSMLHGGYLTPDGRVFAPRVPRALGPPMRVSPAHARIACVSVACAVPMQRAQAACVQPCDRWCAATGVPNGNSAPRCGAGGLLALAAAVGAERLQVHWDGGESGLCAVPGQRAGPH